MYRNLPKKRTVLNCQPSELYTFSSLGPTCPLFTLPNNNNNKECVTHCGLAIYIIKYLKAKEEELWNLKYLFHHAKIYLIFKKSSKRNKNPSRYYISSFNTS
jgi:hypothetical protein